MECGAVASSAVDVRGLKSSLNHGDGVDHRLACSIERPPARGKTYARHSKASDHLLFEVGRCMSIDSPHQLRDRENAQLRLTDVL